MEFLKQIQVAENISNMEGESNGHRERQMCAVKTMALV